MDMKNNYYKNIMDEKITTNTNMNPNNGQNNRILFWVAIGVSILALSVSGILIYELLIVKRAVPSVGESDVVVGSQTSKIDVITYGDYQCGYSIQLNQEIEPLIMKNYVETGKAKMIYKDIPLFGEESLQAAIAARCANEQNKYWEYHSALFKTEIDERRVKGVGKYTGNLNRETFQKIASNLGMDIENFLSCYDSQKYKDAINRDFEEFKKLSNNKPITPTTFIDGNMIVGAKPYYIFEQYLKD